MIKTDELAANLNRLSCFFCSEKFAHGEVIFSIPNPGEESKEEPLKFAHY